VVWTLAWFATLTTEASDEQKWYIIRPMEGLLYSAALWHIALVVVEKGRRIPYLVYAILHMPAFYFVWIWAEVIATRFPV
jgi:hypothetical protein